MGNTNPEKIMLFLLPLITLGLFMAAIVIYWMVNNWKFLADAVG